MATVLGTTNYWPSSNTKANNQPQESNNSSSSSSITAFNFDDSGVGTEDHPNIEPSPAFYNPNTFQQNQVFNQMIYNQPPNYPDHQFSNSPSENMLANNNDRIFNKDLDGSKAAEHMPICSCCQQSITDRFILRVHPNLEFHASCLKCNDCQRTLDENCTVFLRNGRTYCKEDYDRLFARRCQRCDQAFGIEEMVMRARNSAFHLDCFTCATCGRRLGTGEQFVVQGNELYCQVPGCMRIKPESWDPKIQQPMNILNSNRLSMEDSLSAPLSMKNESMDDHTNILASSSNIQPLQQQQQQYSSNQKPPILNQSTLHQSSLSSNSSASSISGRHSISAGTSGSGRRNKKDKPTQRVRTVLTEQQLKILKHMYTINQRPDATTKETLVQQTGLSQRVIRVWFQNKRCKDKKKQNLAIEQEQHMEREQAICGVRMSGIGPIVALSPISLQDSGLMNPINIRQFPQNPSLWNSSYDAPNNPPTLADLSYSSTHQMMMNTIPTSTYQHEMDNISPDYGNNHQMNRYNHHSSSMGLNIPLANNNGLPSSSLSSSPACSD